jgi:cytosine/adenosine deaminase-related metal-dependent hydrolase
MNHDARQPEPQPKRDAHAPYHTDALLSAWLSESSTRNTAPAIVRVDARAIADAQLGIIEHASLVLQRENGRVVVRYAGTTLDLPPEHTNPDMPVLTLHDKLIIPALVNAHTHLDLTHIGPQPHQPGDGFVPWVDMIRANRASQDDQIADCVRQGIEKSLAGGVIAVGDIAGAPAGRLCNAPALALSKSPLQGVSYLEFFGIGSTATSTTERLETYLTTIAPAIIEQLDATGVRLGLQPHAPNTVDLGVYRAVTHAATQLGMPMCTHLAETIEERTFIATGTGPQRDMLERFGVWDDAILESIAMGKHPIEHLRPVLAMHPYLVAHVNDADDQGIQTLQSTNTSVAYCPRASAYFGAAEHFGSHRYRDMLDAGVNVCLGTDSIVNLDTPDRISVLDDMRLLAQQGDSDPQRLLAMGTINGAKALGLDPQRFMLATGHQPTGLIALDLDEMDEGDVWSNAMHQISPPCWLFLE